MNLKKAKERETSLIKYYPTDSEITKCSTSPKKTTYEYGDYRN